jgi:hypothetical protein
MKLALVQEGDDFGIYDDAARRAGRETKFGMLNLNQADVTIEAQADAPRGLPVGSYDSLESALLALREAGFEFEKYQ